VSPVGRQQTTNDGKMPIKKAKVFEMTPSNQPGKNMIFNKKHVKMRAAQYASFNNNKN
jgi:hypothetical protein